jgi:hypothetical protein
LYLGWGALAVLPIQLSGRLAKQWLTIFLFVLSSTDNSIKNHWYSTLQRKSEGILKEIRYILTAGHEKVVVRATRNE